MGSMQVNITTRVNNKSIQRVEHNGRPHWKISSATLPFDVVMNGGLYTRDQIEANYKTLEGTLAPLGHPTVDGKFVSAFSPEGINVGHVGAWNGAANIEGNRVRIEKMIDIEVAERTENGRRLLERLDAIERGEGEPISTSVAAFLERMEANEQQKKMGAEWVAKISHFDHDAILLDEEPAASVEQGVGLMVNSDNATPIQANSGALVGDSYREKESRIDRAAKKRFASEPDTYAWVADFTDSQAVIVENGGEAKIYGYRQEGAEIVFEDSGTPVVRQESWMAIVANSVKKFFKPQAAPAQTKQEGVMPLTAEEKAELVKEIGDIFADAVKSAVDEAIKPLADQVEEVAANQKAISDNLTANQREEESQMREAVKAKFGDVIANSLTGDALREMHKQCGEAANLAGNSASKHTGLTADVANLPKE